MIKYINGSENNYTRSRVGELYFGISSQCPEIEYIKVAL